MSWRDRFNVTGKFRDAEFVIKTADTIVGRRNQVNEYPLRDKPYIEDMGLKDHEFSVQVFVLEPNVFDKRDALIAALDKPGAGTLVHPYYGTRRVSVLNARVSETTSSGGYCSFNITFVDDGDDAFATYTVDTAIQVQAQVDVARQATLDDFVSRYDVSSMSDGLVTEMEAELNNQLVDVLKISGDAFGAIATQIRAPYNMGSAIQNAIATMAVQAGEPQRALQLYSPVFSAGDNSPAVPQTTSNRQLQANNTQAMQQLIQRTAVIEASNQASLATFSSRNDVNMAGNVLLEALDVQMEAVGIVDGKPVDDVIYDALNELRTLVATDLRVRGSQLAGIVMYTPTATLPALVLSHRLYGDASRDAEIISRNNIRHPGFVPGGDTLEVLKNA